MGLRTEREVEDKLKMFRLTIHGRNTDYLTLINLGKQCEVLEWVLKKKDLL